MARLLRAKDSKHMTPLGRGGSDEYKKYLLRKWESLLEGINDPIKRQNMAILFENEQEHLERTMGGLVEATTTSNIQTYTKFLFPMVRRVWPDLIINDLISVQPMTAPVGGVFYLELKYGQTKGEIDSGDNMIDNMNIWFSHEHVENELTASVGDGCTSVFSITCTYKPLRSDYAVSGVDASGGVATGVIVNATAGTVTLTFSSPPALDDEIYVTYDYNMEQALASPEIYMDLTLQTVTARSRRLRALWSAEAMDDIASLAGMDAESTLMDGIGQEIGIEIDREFIAALLVAGLANVTGTFDASIPTYGYAPQDHYKQLIYEMNIVSRLIQQKTKRGPANWVVTGPRVCALLDFLPEFTKVAPAQMETNPFGNMGIVKYGVLSNRWTVYCDPYWAETAVQANYSSYMLLGYKGPTVFDAGCVYAPYIPLQITPTFLDPNDFRYRKGMRTRYGKKVLKNDYFGVITVSGL